MIIWAESPASRYPGFVKEGQLKELARLMDLYIDTPEVHAIVARCQAHYDRQLEEQHGRNQTSHQVMVG